MPARWGWVAGIAALMAASASHAAAQASIRGVAWDSIGGRPLAGAFVQVARVDNPWVARTYTTGNDGRFSFDSLDLGAWLLGVSHVAFDTLGLEPPLMRVTIAAPASATVMLAVPSALSLRRTWCGALADSGGVWTGRVRSAVDGAPVPRASLVAEWTRIVPDGRRVKRETPYIAMTTNDAGAFRACGVPLDDLVRAQASTASDTSGVLTFSLPPSGIVQRDVYIGPTTIVRRRMVVDTAAGDSGKVDVEVRLGPGRVRGRVVRQGDRAVGGARVRLGETGAEAVTNSEGWFSLDSLPLGSWTFDARAIGFMGQSRQVDVVAGNTSEAMFVLESRQAFLDTVKVVGQRVVDAPWHRDFLERKRRGFGYFVDQEEVERRNPLYVSDLLRTVPGAYVTPGSFGGRILFRGSSFSSAYCTPDLYINGMYVQSMGGMSVEDFVSTMDVVALEVYPRAVNVPAQYQRMNGCGALLVWTGSRRRLDIPKDPGELPSS